MVVHQPSSLYCRCEDVSHQPHDNQAEPACCILSIKFCEGHPWGLGWVRNSEVYGGSGALYYNHHRFRSSVLHQSPQSTCNLIDLIEKQKQDGSLAGLLLHKHLADPSHNYHCPCQYSAYDSTTPTGKPGGFLTFPPT